MSSRIFWVLILLGIAPLAHAAPRDPVTCLAQNVYYESAREPLAGEIAVAVVTLNRAGGDPQRVCAAVYFKHTDPETGLKVAAFSWTLGRAWRAPGPVNRTLYARALFVARGVLGGSLHAPFGPAVKWYHRIDCHPDWHKHFVVRIGHHLFYRDG